MENFGDLKKTARIGMRGKWLQGIAVCLSLWIPGLLTGIVEYILRLLLHVPAFLQGEVNSKLASMAASMGCGLLCFLLWAPLWMGAVRWYWQGYRQEEPCPRTLMFYFDEYLTYLKAVGMWASVAIRLFFWFALFSLPSLAAGGLYAWCRFMTGLPLELGAVEPLFWAVLIIWPILAFFLAAIVGQRYLLAPRFLAENPHEPVRRLIRRSVRFMRGYAVQAFFLRLSFFSWYLPGFIGGGVLLVSFGWVGYEKWLFPIAGGLFLVQGILGFYLRPWKNAVLARYSGQLVYGESVFTDENVTKEYDSGNGDLLSPPIPPTIGAPGVP